VLQQSTSIGTKVFLQEDNNGQFISDTHWLLKVMIIKMWKFFLLSCESEAFTVLVCHQLAL